MMSSPKFRSLLHLAVISVSAAVLFSGCYAAGHTTTTPSTPKPSKPTKISTSPSKATSSPAKSPSGNTNKTKKVPKGGK